MVNFEYVLVREPEMCKRCSLRVLRVAFDWYSRSYSHLSPIRVTGDRENLLLFRRDECRSWQGQCEYICCREDLVLETKNSSNYTIQLEINGHVGTCSSDSEINFGQNNSILYYEENRVENKSLQFEFELNHVAGLRWDERYTVTLYGEFKKDAYSTTVNQLSADREGSEHYENGDGTYRLEGSYYLHNYNYVNITKIEITYPC